MSLKRRTTYSVWSDLSVPGEQELRTETMANLPEDIKRLYLQLPRRLNPRIRQLAHDIVRDAAAVTPFDKARAIESYLKTRFGYTLNLTINGDDPLYEFLFDVREGHCEYFATAMVIMLRTLDIPARIVNGFQMGEYNDVNHMFTVHEQLPRERPDVNREVFRMLVESRKAAPPEALETIPPFGVEANRTALQFAIDAN